MVMVMDECRQVSLTLLIPYRTGQDRHESSSGVPTGYGTDATKARFFGLGCRCNLILPQPKPIHSSPIHPPSSPILPPPISQTPTHPLPPPSSPSSPITPPLPTFVAEAARRRTVATNLAGACGAHAWEGRVVAAFGFLVCGIGLGVRVGGVGFVGRHLCGKGGVDVFGCGCWLLCCIVG